MLARDRILILTDLFLGALWADDDFSADEQRAVRQLLADLLDVTPSTLPGKVENRISNFEPLTFDLPLAVAEFADDPPQAKKRLIELVAHMVHADGVVDLREEAYLQELAAALGLDAVAPRELELHYAPEELRATFGELRSAPPPRVDPVTRNSRPPPPPMVPNGVNAPSVSED